MKVIEFESITALTDQLSIALGYFDGVHVAHQCVIEKAVANSVAHQRKSAVLTFSPNPNVVLKKIEQTTLLTPFSEKTRVLTNLGVDYLIIVPFTKDLAHLEPEAFISHILKPLNVKHVVTGFDFKFGRLGLGTVETLKQFTSLFSVEVVDKQMVENEKIGTTQIKAYLSKGDVTMVANMLGRPYRIKGQVVTGQQKGREIGFPTANLALSEPFEVPARGVYVVRAWVRGQGYEAMCNIGHNPTFNYNENISIEVHVLDFEGDIYGEELEIEFLTFVREEQKFSSIQALMTQLAADENSVRAYFKK